MCQHSFAFIPLLHSLPPTLSTLSKVYYVSNPSTLRPLKWPSSLHVKLVKYYHHKRQIVVASTKHVSISTQEKISNMRLYKQEEKLLFVPSVASDLSLSDFSDLPPLHVVYGYPNTYSVGICSLGYQLVWAKLATTIGVTCSRIFTDAMEPLPSDYDLLGFSLAWELDYAGLFSQLEYLNLALRSQNRKESDPIVFAGGPVLSANPEPFADFLDVILIGDGEELLDDFVRACQEAKILGWNRKKTLVKLAKIPGVYVPQLYIPSYEGRTGPFLELVPVTDEIPQTIEKRTYRGKSLAASTVVSARSAWENIYMIEAVRSCPEMCRFCLASYVTLPFRPASVDEFILPELKKALKVTNRIGILGASITQHPEFDRIIDILLSEEFKDTRVSLSSVRTNTVTEKLARMLTNRGSKSITIAVESGSERLRNIVNKKLTNSEIVEACTRAKAGGLSSVKLYGMVGIPGECDQDLEETFGMFDTLKKATKGGGASFTYTFGCSTFVPKAHTPFQWFGVSRDGDKKLKFCERHLGKMGIEFRPESYKWSTVQGLISRGDRRLGKIFELAREEGDSAAHYKRAFKNLKGTFPNYEYFVHENWDISQPLPWGHLKTAISDSMIRSHYDDAISKM